MKGVLTLFLLILIGLNLWTVWQVQQLRQDVAALQARVHKAEQADTVLSDLMTRAAPLLAQAREAIQKADYTQARRLIAEAQAKANHAGRTLGEQSGPALAWLRQQTQSLEAQMQKR